jgi:hypothetical protein
MQSAPALVGTPKLMMVGCASSIITTTITYYARIEVLSLIMMGLE